MKPFYLGGAGLMALALSACVPSGLAPTPQTYADMSLSTPAPAPVEVIVPSLDNLANQPPEEVIRFLGEPVLVRNEPGAQLWTYSNDQCRLYFIFFEGENQVLRLHHMESESLKSVLGADMDRLQDCVGAVATLHQTRPQTAFSPAPSS